jgi:putative transposase
MVASVEEIVRYTYRLRSGTQAGRTLLDFRPRFLSRSTMAHTAADAAIGTTKRELIERGVRAGRKVVLVPPAYITRTYSECFARAKQPLGLAERVFRRAQCGYTADRDRNAARTILATVEPDRAGVDDVRHHWPPPEEASGAVRVGNPPASAVGGVNGLSSHQMINRR